MYIIGVSCFFHDSAACLLKDWQIVSAAQEERFSRIKHDKSFPRKAIDFCLESQNISILDVELVVFYEKPFLKFDRILNTLQSQVPTTFKLFKNTLTSWLKSKLWVSSIIKDELKYNGEILYSEHHEAHAAGSFFTSPFKEAVIVTIDGVGEKTCTSIALGKDNSITMLQEQHYPHSVGLLYSGFTQYCGFKVNSGEYKLMGLAPYGKPIYTDKILEHIVSYDANGVVTLNMTCFSFEKGKSTINKKFCDVFGKSGRKPSAAMDQFYKDVAASIQQVLEDIVICIVKYAKALTGQSNLCLSGGVALNCKANGELLTKEIFDNIWVQPASGDAGSAVGAAYIGYYHYLKNDRVILPSDLDNQIYLGPNYKTSEIELLLKEHKLIYKNFSDADLCETVSEALKNKKIVGWFQGKMEFGPRALGHRSILASPLFKDMKTHVNLNIKFREGFRPFAPIAIEEDAKDWFDTLGTNSKYMLFTYKSNKNEQIPSCVHEDETARLQTLNKEDNLKLHQLISAFKQKTDCPVLINTSFNVRGEPIVATPFDALKCFFYTKMDVLVLDNFVISKESNPIVPNKLKIIAPYELD